MTVLALRRAIMNLHQVFLRRLAVVVVADTGVEADPVDIVTQVVFIIRSKWDSL